MALIGPAPLPHRPQPLDTRTAALLESSVDMLKALGVWEALRPHAAPLKAIRIIDASGSLFRAPDVEFRASELGLDAFGYNIANSVLIDVLYAKAAGSVAALYPSNVERVELTPSHARLNVAQGAQICARLVAGADGRNSICRKAAGIAASEQAYGQAAIATSFTHRAPHRGVSIELHRQGGSVTTVPLTGPAASSVIWIDGTEEIEAVMRLDAEDFVAALQDRLEGLLGQVEEAGARAQFPITRLAAETLAGRRTALVGEAAHILPPIGAQGLNLGLRDAATLADCVGEARKHGGDPGSDERARRLRPRPQGRCADPHLRHRSLEPLVALGLPAVAGCPRHRLAWAEHIAAVAASRHAHRHDAADRASEPDASWCTVKALSTPA